MLAGRDATAARPRPSARIFAVDQMHEFSYRHSRHPASETLGSERLRCTSPSVPATSQARQQPFAALRFYAEVTVRRQSLIVRSPCG